MDRRLGLWTLTSALVIAAIGCGGDPEPLPNPDGEVVAPPADDGSTPKGDEKDDAKVDAERPKDLVIKMEVFPEAVMALKPDDLVELTLERGAIKARVTSVKARLLTVTTHGTAITSRFRPEEIQAVRLLYREDPSEVTFTADAPLNEDETWLERFADRSILGEDPGSLWQERFAKNTPLTVTRGFRIRVLTFLKRRGPKSYFLPEDKPEVIKKHDQIKLIGMSNGLERNPEGKDEELGEVLLYLLRRGQDVQLVCSRDRLDPKRIKVSALKRFLRSEPVVLAVARPGSTKHLKIARVPGSTARKYRQVMQKTPDRPEIRRLRAARSDELKKAEQQVLSIYRAVELEEESEQEEPIVVKLRVPSTEGGIYLAPFEKELGLD